MYHQNPTTNSYKAVDRKMVFGPGFYSVTIDVSHVYIGPHKNGEHFSLNLRVSQITYQSIPSAPPALPFKKPDGRGRRRGGKNAAKTEEAN